MMILFEDNLLNYILAIRLLYTSIIIGSIIYDILKSMIDVSIKQSTQLLMTAFAKIQF